MEKIFEELGLESLQLRRWFRELSCFYKLFNNEPPHYLFKLIASRSSSMLLQIYIIFLFLKSGICSCGLNIESTAHFLLHCRTYITGRHTLLSTIENIDNNILDLCEPVLIKALIFDSNSFDTNANKNVLNATILSTKKIWWTAFSMKRGFSNKIMNQ